MYSSKSYKLKKDEYNYLLPVLRNKLLNKGEKHYFIGSSCELDDMLNRLQGLYDRFDYVNKMICYKCFVNGSLEPFRNK